MPRDPGLLERDPCHQRVDGVFAAAQRLDDAPAGGIGQGLEYVRMHVRIYILKRI